MCPWGRRTHSFPVARGVRPPVVLGRRPVSWRSERRRLLLRDDPDELGWRPRFARRPGNDDDDDDDGTTTIDGLFFVEEEHRLTCESRL
mmetsp:Transcript_5016/g.20586  ORF Transcript_5016/g.20586 Transcript_5016/m.20586 type:complete len:89 (+) Transcript_5016:1661-1927(+)